VVLPSAELVLGHVPRELLAQPSGLLADG